MSPGTNLIVQLSLLNDTGNWHHIEEEESETFFYVVYATMHEAVGQLKAGKSLDAAKYLGSLLHFIEDNGCPVHGVDNILLAELMPPPQKLVPFALHGAVESACVSAGHNRI